MIIKHCHIVVLIALNFFSNNLLAESYKNFHSLSDNLVESENYEIVKLINGEVKAVLYIKETNNVLVVTNDHLWKLNQKGYVVDTLRRPSGLTSSGIVIRKNSYENPIDDFRFIDWVYTGNKLEQKLEVIDANSLSDVELSSYLDQADIVEFIYGYTGDRSYAFSLLKRKDGWKALDITSRHDQLNRGYDTEYKNRNYEIWKEVLLEGYEKKYKNKLSPIANSLPYKPDWEDNNFGISINKFSRRYRYDNDRGNLLERIYLRSQGYTLAKPFWFGQGYLVLNHQSELLQFKAFISKQEDGLNFDNFSIYDLPEDLDSDTRFMGITYIGAQHNYLDKLDKVVSYHEKDVGFYALRKKTRASSNPISTSNNKIASDQNSISLSRNHWQPVIRGMLLNGDKYNQSYSTWSDIKFYNNEVEDLHYLMTPAFVPVSTHDIPQEVAINWYPPNEKTGHAFKLYASENESSWHYLTRDDRSVYFSLVFDKNEILAAFEKLNVKSRPLQLEISMNEIENVGASISVKLRSGKDEILLQRSHIKASKEFYDQDDTERAINFEKGKLKVEFKRALEDSHYLQDYMDASSSMAQSGMHVNDYSRLFIKYSNQLLNKYSEIKDQRVVEKIIYHFISELLSYIKKFDEDEELLAGLEVITSNSLGIATFYNSHDLSSEIFEKLLGRDFDIFELSNGTLIYNLASYYSVNEKKPEMLVAIKQAMLKGKLPSQFESDSDFKNYLNDVDFLRLIRE